MVAASARKSRHVRIPTWGESPLPGERLPSTLSRTHPRSLHAEDRPPFAARRIIVAVGHHVRERPLRITHCGRSGNGLVRRRLLRGRLAQSEPGPATSCLCTPDLMAESQYRRPSPARSLPRPRDLPKAAPIEAMICSVSAIATVHGPGILPRRAISRDGAASAAYREADVKAVENRATLLRHCTDACAGELARRHAGHRTCPDRRHRPHRLAGDCLGRRAWGHTPPSPSAWRSAPQLRQHMVASARAPALLRLRPPVRRLVCFARSHRIQVDDLRPGDAGGVLFGVSFLGPEALGGAVLVWCDRLDPERRDVAHRPTRRKDVPTY